MKKKIFGLIGCMLILLTACQDQKEEKINQIKISSREIFDEDNLATKAHFDILSTEYLEIEYNGERTYSLDFQVWEHGEMRESQTKMLEINLANLDGISISVNEKSITEYEVTIVTYEDEGYCSAVFPFEIKEMDLNGRLESKIFSETVFSEEKEVALWGFHRFDNQFEIFEDSKEAAEQLEWSLLFVLKPEIEKKI